jgi:hypothetical protein
MYLLIDVRTSSLSDIPTLYYAMDWADAWMLAHPDDRITFLAFEGDPIEWYECIFVSRTWQLFGRKIANHPYGPDRVVSFSKLPPIDTSIPMILHIDDLSEGIYPRDDAGFLARHRYTHTYKKNLNHARHIIIPHHEIGNNLAELYSADQDKISVIPYLRNPKNPLMSNMTILPHGVYAPYLLTECTPGQEWNPRWLIAAYREYIHEKSWEHKLIILWDLGSNLSYISTMIRNMNLIEKVKLVWVLSRRERESLYAHTEGWIYAWHYYSRWASISLAESHSVPLYIADIPWLMGYGWVSFHPNHTDTLSDILIWWREASRVRERPHNQLIMEAYTRILSE